MTDIALNDSLLLVAGDQRVIDSIEYPRVDSRLFRLDAVVSRKKQLLPHLARHLAKLDKSA